MWECNSEWNYSSGGRETLTFLLHCGLNLNSPPFTLRGRSHWCLNQHNTNCQWAGTFSYIYFLFLSHQMDTLGKKKREKWKMRVFLIVDRSIHLLRRHLGKVQAMNFLVLAKNTLRCIPGGAWLYPHMRKSWPLHGMQVPLMLFCIIVCTSTASFY